MHNLYTTPQTSPQSFLPTIPAPRSQRLRPPRFGRGGAGASGAGRHDDRGAEAGILSVDHRGELRAVHVVGALEGLRRPLARADERLFSTLRC